MKKRFYSVCAMALAISASAFAQAVIDTDYACEYPFDEGDYAGESAVIVAGATVTMMNEAVNTCGFPFLNGETVTLLEGGKVKFFDSPESAYPNPDEFPDYTGYMKDAAGAVVTAIPFNWVIEGTGNEIYLDSYCTLGGTISGAGDVTIYVGNQNTINMAGIYTTLDASVNFTGRIFLKELEGYKCDTVHLGGSFPGFSKVRIPFLLDIDALDDDVVLQTANNPNIPMITGKGIINVGGSGSFFSADSLHSIGNVVDLTWEGAAASKQHDNYHDGGSSDPITIVMNGDVNMNGTYYYLRTDVNLIINGHSFSNITSSLSLREGAILAGDGIIDCPVYNNAHRLNWTTAGQGHNSIGTLTIKEYGNNSNQNSGLAFDFDGKSCDQIVFTQKGKLSSGTQHVYINLMDEFFTGTPQTGNYLVLNGPIEEGATPIIDTIGIYAYDGEMLFDLYDSTTMDYTDSIQYSVNLDSKFPEATFVWQEYWNEYFQRQDTIVSGYDGNNRYRHNLMFWGPGTGIESAYVPSAGKPDSLGANWAVIAQSLVDSLTAAVTGQIIPGTNEQARFRTPNITTVSTDNNGVKPLTYQYDKVINYSFLLSSNKTVKVSDAGDTLINYGSNHLRRTWKSTVTDTIVDAAGDSTFVETEVVDWTTNRVKVGEKEYWFDFSKFFTNGVIALCSEDYPEVDLSKGLVDRGDGGTDITTIKQENKMVKTRQIYTIDGKRVNNYVKGLNIVTTQYTNGVVETKKVFIAE